MVPLRDAWSSESSDFTPWLAREENLKLLGEAIGLDLELESQEQAVDQYRADIVCKELENNQRVVIENQIEETDHKHLGQVLTYAAGLDAVILIWVAKNFTEPHRAALDWLNERANGTASFFGIEIELYRIGNSPPAPRFNVVSKPNDWSNRLKQAVNEAGFNEAEKLRLEYWTAMVAALKAVNFRFEPYKPTSKVYLKIRQPIRDCSAGFEVYLQEGEIAIYLGSEKSETIIQLRRLLQTHQADLEIEMGGSLQVKDTGENKRFWIEFLTSADASNRSDWPRQHAWLHTNLEKLIAAVSRRLEASE